MSFHGGSLAQTAATDSSRHNSTSRRLEYRVNEYERDTLGSRLSTACASKTLTALHRETPNRLSRAVSFRDSRKSGPKAKWKSRKQSQSKLAGPTGRNPSAQANPPSLCELRRGRPAWVIDDERIGGLQGRVNTTTDRVGPRHTRSARLPCGPPKGFVIPAL